jgi:LysM repeat protein
MRNNARQLTRWGQVWAFDRTESWRSPLLRLRVVFPSVVLMLALLSLGSIAVQADQGTVHQVRTGETLGAIARQHGLTAQALAAANRLSNPDVIQVGRSLTVPAGGQAKAKPAAPDSATPEQPARTYVVRSGDTLAQIARTLGVPSASLASANGLTNPDRITVGMTLKMPGSGAAPTPRQVTDTRFIASISEQRCWLFKDGELIGDWRCSSGRKEAPSVPGSYRIQSMIRDAYGSRWDFWMPYWLGLYYAGSTENGIHGLPYDKKTGRRTWEGLVGTPITFGCIMLDDANARKLFETAYIGMPVVILP